MKWYTKYLQVYEQPFDSAPKEAVDFVKTKLQKLSENKQPLASVILICYNEEKRLLSCLWSLCDNICDFPIEILAVNNNSSDRTESVLQQLGVTYFNELKKVRDGLMSENSQMPVLYEPDSNHYYNPLPI